eukprot:TRINITY_DN17247_c0_g1_i1.p1 TRINITY_DN17247_c0_g1~~TRINITY_DN17247_c0_g1_i1.p1  ORF type:complete len:912 (-),score=116.54 TRINITY_DN17247_c0_g1_i1:475-3186(-)
MQFANRIFPLASLLPPELTPRLKRNWHVSVTALWRPSHPLVGVRRQHFTDVAVARVSQKRPRTMASPVLSAVSADTSTSVHEELVDAEVPSTARSAASPRCFFNGASPRYQAAGAVTRTMLLSRKFAKDCRKLGKLNSAAASNPVVADSGTHSRCNSDRRFELATSEGGTEFCESVVNAPVNSGMDHKGWPPLVIHGKAIGSVLLRQASEVEDIGGVFSRVARAAVDAFADVGQPVYAAGDEVKCFSESHQCWVRAVVTHVIEGDATIRFVGSIGTEVVRTITSTSQGVPVACAASEASGSCEVVCRSDSGRGEARPPADFVADVWKGRLRPHFREGDSLQCFSVSQGRWMLARVDKVTPRMITVSISVPDGSELFRELHAYGDRVRSLDGKNGLHFDGFRTGEPVQVYSCKRDAWLEARVVGVKQAVVIVAYDGRTGERVVKELRVDHEHIRPNYRKGDDVRYFCEFERTWLPACIVSPPERFVDVSYKVRGSTTATKRLSTSSDHLKHLEETCSSDNESEEFNIWSDGEGGELEEFRDRWEAPMPPRGIVIKFNNHCRNRLAERKDKRLKRWGGMTPRPQLEGMTPRPQTETTHFVREQIIESTIESSMAERTSMFKPEAIEEACGKRRGSPRTAASQCPRHIHDETPLRFESPVYEVPAKQTYGVDTLPLPIRKVPPLAIPADLNSAHCGGRKAVPKLATWVAQRMAARRLKREVNEPVNGTDVLEDGLSPINSSRSTDMCASARSVDQPVMVTGYAPESSRSKTAYHTFSVTSTTSIACRLASRRRKKAETTTFMVLKAAAADDPSEASEVMSVNSSAAMSAESRKAQHEEWCCSSTVFTPTDSSSLLAAEMASEGTALCDHEVELSSPKNIAQKLESAADEVQSEAVAPSAFRASDET